MRQKTGTSTTTETRSFYQDDVLPAPRRPRTEDSKNSSQTSLPNGRFSASGIHLPGTGSKRYFHSRRIDPKTDIQKPWTAKKDPKKKWQTIIPLMGVLIGLGLCALECWQGYTSVINHNYCLILDEDFSSGTLDESVWSKEVGVGGFGNGQFEETTNTDENVFIKDGELWIKPTLQEANLVNFNNKLDLTGKGCTSSAWTDCHAVTNTTNGTIINPVKSGRINTKKGAQIQYGRVEVSAKLPVGDWLWPAIWMLPVENVYGDWPASGEIDIAESRGNNWTYKYGGNEIASSALHWGPTDPVQDAWYKTFGKKEALHTTFADTWHVFGLEWSEKYLFTYVDNRLRETLYVPFTQNRWNQGNFDTSSVNGSAVLDPWSQTGRSSTPFDQPFFLILDVAVGATNAWFADDYGSKPWLDSSLTAPDEFWQAKDQWYPTWQDRGQMQVRSVKMWQQQGYRGCTKGKKGY